MFRVKICGISSVADAEAAVAAGADALGLNFYQGSPRYCPVETAEQIAAALPAGICKVGVFVNAPTDEVVAIARQVGLDLVQLHGDELPEQLREVRCCAVMRALRVSNDWSNVSQYLAACHRLNAMPRMLLVDAVRPGQFGGTGQVADWPAIVANRARFSGLPLVLAGGLKPGNVAEAIAAVRPWGVDTASGVEDSPGKKSAALMKQFVSAAKAALTQAAKHAH